MCGIAGYIGRGTVDEGRIAATLDLMRERGPDHRGHAIFTHGDITVALLHTRLSIIDLDARANQPFTEGPATLVFNGEIYNYVELREGLEKKGVRFRTSSDTEVLLKSYLARGERCVEAFEGMFSFAIFDAREGKLFMARDRFAEKPLYWLQTPDGIYFASETRAIRALSGSDLTVNMRHVYRYLVNGYKSLYKVPETFYEEIREVPFATTMTVGPDLSVRTARYWTPRCRLEAMTLEEAIGGFKERLLEAVRIRLRADVPLAFCLSGGIDSGAITSIAAKVFDYDVATFSIIDSDERYNEIDNVRATIDDLGCAHTIIDIPKDGTFERLEDLIRYHDAPVATISYLIHSYLSEAVAGGGFRVVASGTAADELVTGYYDHFNLHLYEMRDHPDFEAYLSDWEANTGRFVRNPHLKNPRLYFDDPGFRDHIYLNNDVFASFLTAEFAEAFTEQRFCDSLLRNRMANEMFAESVPVILHEDDLNSMRYSIENRSPYLDSRLFDFSYSIPAEHLIRDGYGKYILREAVSGILNDQVRLDRVKKGFNASIHSLVDFDAPATRERLLGDSPIWEFVRRDRIEQAMGMNPMPNSYSKFMFDFINAKMFLEMEAA